MFKKIRFFILYTSLLFFFIGCNNSEAVNLIQTDKSVLQLYKETLSSQKYIAHALGGDEKNNVQYDYINSVEVLKKWYRLGFRLFEVDVYETSDGELVLSHRAGEGGNLLEKDCVRLGLTYPSNPTYEEFMKCKSYGIYETSSFKQLCEYMANEGTELFVMIDIQNRNYDDTKRLYQKMYYIAGGNKNVLNHFIAGGWTTDMIRACKEIYNFPIINLYWADKSVREFEKEKDFVNYCKSIGVQSFSTSINRFSNKEYPKQLVDNLFSYVFTVNNEIDAEQYLMRGANIVGIDYYKE